MAHINKKIKTFFRTILLITVLIIVLFSAFEIGLRVWAVSWKVIYRFFNSNKNIINIYSAGASTMEGHPYLEISIPKITSYIFDNKINGKRINIVDLSKKGTTIEHVYWKIYTELLLRPPNDGVLLVYSGINDEFADINNEKIIKIWQLLRGSLIFSKMQYLYAQKYNTSSKKILPKLIGVNYSQEKYKYFLKKIIRLGRSYDLDIVIFTLVSNISDFSPLVPGPEKDSEEYIIYKKIKEDEDAGNVKIALSAYENMIETVKSEYKPHIYYRIAKCLEKTGDFRAAEDYYYKVIEHTKIMRVVRKQNVLIREIARMYEVELVDSEKLFRNNSKNGLIGHELIIDAHHPNLTGYILLATQLSNILEKKYNEKAVNKKINEEVLIQYFNCDMLEVYFRCFKAFAYLGPPFYLEERLNKAVYYLKKIHEIDNSSEKYVFGMYIVSLLKGDVAAIKFWIEKVKNLSNKMMYTPNIKDSWIEDHIENMQLPEDVMRTIRNRVYD